MSSETPMNMIKVSSLKVNPQNPREITPKKFDALVKSIKDFPKMMDLRPMVVDDTNTVLGGNMRLKAIQKLGMEEIPESWIRRADSLTEEERKRFLAVDNLAYGTWTDDIANLYDLAELKDWGFDEKDLNLFPDVVEEPVVDVAPQVDKAAELNKVWQVKAGDLWTVGPHRLLCGDSRDAASVAFLLNGEEPEMMVTDPPYGIEYDPSWRADAGINKNTSKMGKVANDDIADWSPAWRLFPGAIAYVYHAGVMSSTVQASLEVCGFKIRAQIIWAKDRMALSRGDYHWQHEPCQPAGTMVSTPNGQVPIEQLRDGDGVLSFDSYSGQIVGKRTGRSVRVASRQYDGDMFTISCDGKKTKVTDGHQFTVRFSERSAVIWNTYLMRRGDWWRIGILRTFNSRGFGPAVRLSQENGDEMWLLGSHTTKTDAQCAEQVLSISNGIPTTHWETDRNRNAHGETRTTKQIRDIYARLDLVAMARQAGRLLTEFGRQRKYPLVNRETLKIRKSRSQTAQIRACNLTACIMEVPIPTTGSDFKWRPITSTERTPYNGIVYSLDVDKDHHYIADGIVTHNCWYAIRDGATGKRNDDRTQTTLWTIPARDDEGHGHGTQKPLECMLRPIRNHDVSLIYDPFLGSGTTMVAAESLKKRCFGMELNPDYCAVILTRMRESYPEIDIKRVENVSAAVV